LPLPTQRLSTAPEEEDGAPRHHEPHHGLHASHPCPSSFPPTRHRLSIQQIRKQNFLLVPASGPRGSRQQLLHRVHLLYALLSSHLSRYPRAVQPRERFSRLHWPAVAQTDWVWVRGWDRLSWPGPHSVRRASLQHHHHSNNCLLAFSAWTIVAIIYFMICQKP